MHRPVRIITLTAAGQRLAQTLLSAMPDAQVWLKPKPFAPMVQQAFIRGEALVMICATGIAVRSLAPVLHSKQDDPPVLVLDEQGHFVIPLLSGHQGGANEWASCVASQLGAQVVMTTAKPYLAPVYTVGMGCERGCSQAHLRALLMGCVQRSKLVCQQLHSINSIDLKADEPGLLALAESLQKPYQTFDRLALRSVEHLLSIRSDYVFNTVGVYGVAEAAALIATERVTGQSGELVLTKVKTAKATCAIARSYPQPVPADPPT